MRTRVLLLAMLGFAAAAIVAITALGGIAAPVSGPMLAQNGATPVDTELVLAVDISYSMDPEEQALQREGYMQAIYLARIHAGAQGWRQRPHLDHLFRMGERR